MIKIKEEAQTLIDTLNSILKYKSLSLDDRTDLYLLKESLVNNLFKWKSIQDLQKEAFEAGRATKLCYSVEDYYYIFKTFKKYLKKIDKL